MIWKRKLPQALGYSSLFTYCLERLRYPRTSAARRAAAAKVAIELPKVIDYLADGRVGLGAVYELRDVLDDELLERAVGMTEDEARYHGATLRGDPTDRVLPLNLKVSTVFMRTLDECRDAFGHTVPDRDTADVLHESMVRALAADGKKRVGTGARYVPAHVARAVRQRAEHCCEFVGVDGHRRRSRFMLELDHVTAFAHGGKSTVANLKLHCRSHNEFRAELAGLGWSRSSGRNPVTRA